MAWLLYFLICIGATTLGAISGIGGGVIIKPVMDAVANMSVSSISFLSGCTVLGMSVVSVLRGRGGDVKLDPRKGTWMALGGAVGGVFGKWVFDAIRTAFGNDSLVGVIQSGIMVLLTLGVLVYVLNKDKIRTLQVERGPICLVIGLGLGIASSFLGIGGGPINLVVLYYFFSMNTKTAALHSLYVILFSQTASFLTTVVGGKVPEFDPLVLAVMVVGGILGGFVGRWVSRKMSGSQVDRLFRGMLILIAVISGYNLCHYAGWI
ncbi:MAG: sulfite exporter TauE/SafE family protein [Clostridia bacterium]|nr:sulfite exporter TauE/SafE family protein [Clostridia bacterium]